MVNFITQFFNWTTILLSTFLQTEIIDGIKFLHVILFLGIVSILVKFFRSRGGKKNDKSE